MTFVVGLERAADVAPAAVVVVAGGIGAAAYFLSRPQPLISITSKYKVGNAVAGAQGTGEC